jgi:hypothetical protein
MAAASALLLFSAHSAKKEQEKTHPKTGGSFDLTG